MAHLPVVVLDVCLWIALASNSHRAWKQHPPKSQGRVIDLQKLRVLTGRERLQIHGFPKEHS